MLSEFLVYLNLGYDHIVDLDGYDHILFIAALSAGYALIQWRQLLVLVTAFTVGHSVTLALATLGLIIIGSALVEILIPLTILLTSLYNLVETVPSSDADEPAPRSRRVRYGLALVFGLIHGLGFSTYLRAVLGEEESIALPLFAFNVGLELGQIGILLVLLLLTLVMVQGLGVKQVFWTRLLSGVILLATLILVVERTLG